MITIVIAACAANRFISGGVFGFMHSMLYATARNEKEAVRIAARLLQKKLVACANIFPVRSLYRWKGRISDENEFVIVMKTRKSLVPKSIEEAARIHSYEVPCLVSYEMDKGLPAYLNWIDEQTESRGR